MGESWSERQRKSGHGGLPNLGFGATLVTAFVSSFFAAKIADAIFIIIRFGPHAYFVDGLRVADWKHGVLSTGSKLSGINELLRGPLNLVVWVALIGATELTAGMLRKAFRGKSLWLIAILRLSGGSLLLLFAEWWWERGFSLHPIPVSSFIAAFVLIWQGIKEMLQYISRKSGP